MTPLLEPPTTFNNLLCSDELQKVPFTKIPRNAISRLFGKELSSYEVLVVLFLSSRGNYNSREVRVSVKEICDNCSITKKCCLRCLKKLYGLGLKRAKTNTYDMYELAVSLRKQHIKSEEGCCGFWDHAGLTGKWLKMPNNLIKTLRNRKTLSTDRPMVNYSCHAVLLAIYLVFYAQGRDLKKIEIDLKQIVDVCGGNRNTVFYSLRAMGQDSLIKISKGVYDLSGFYETLRQLIAKTSS